MLPFFAWPNIMAIPLAGRAVITGAASGLGHAISQQLAGCGWTIAAVDLPDADFTGLQESVAAAGGVTLPFPFDVRERIGWEQLADRLQAEWPSIDLVVTAAGVGATGEVGTLPMDQWQRVIETNLLGTVIGCEILLPRLRQQASPSRLLAVASIAGLLAPPSMAAYSASKAGVIALAEAIAGECRGQPSVTIACPGFFRSGLLNSWHFTGKVERREAQRRMEATGWTSERVAERALAATFAGRRYLVLGRQARWLWRLKRLTPTLATGLISRVYHRLGR